MNPIAILKQILSPLLTLLSYFIGKHAGKKQEEQKQIVETLDNVRQIVKRQAKRDLDPNDIVRSRVRKYSRKTS